MNKKKCYYSECEKDAEMEIEITQKYAYCREHGVAIAQKDVEEYAGYYLDNMENITIRKVLQNE